MFFAQKLVKWSTLHVSWLEQMAGKMFLEPRQRLPVTRITECLRMLMLQEPVRLMERGAEHNQDVLVCCTEGFKFNWYKHLIIVLIRTNFFRIFAGLFYYVTLQRILMLKVKSSVNNCERCDNQYVKAKILNPRQGLETSRRHLCVLMKRILWRARPYTKFLFNHRSPNCSEKRADTRDMWSHTFTFAMYVIVGFNFKGIKTPLKRKRPLLKKAK